MAWFEREFTKKLSPEKIYFPSGRGLLLIQLSSPAVVNAPSFRRFTNHITP